MSSPGRVVTIRMSQDLAEKLAALRAEFASLPQSILLRMLLAHVLDRPLSAQVKVITRELRKPRFKAEALR